MKIVNEGIDMVRREEVAINQVLKKTRYLWLKNPDNLTKEQNKTLGTLKDMNLKTVRAHNLKLSLQIFRSMKNAVLLSSILNGGTFGLRIADYNR